MSRHDDSARLQHMLDHAREASKLSDGRSRSDLDHDRLFSLAMARLVEVIGEAALKVTEQIRAASTEIPWRAITGMRNRLIHGYDKVDHVGAWRQGVRQSIILKRGIAGFALCAATVLSGCSGTQQTTSYYERGLWMDGSNIEALAPVAWARVWSDVPFEQHGQPEFVVLWADGFMLRGDDPWSPITTAGFMDAATIHDWTREAERSGFFELDPYMAVIPDAPGASICARLGGRANVQYSVIGLPPNEWHGNDEDVAPACLAMWSLLSSLRPDDLKFAEAYADADGWVRGFNVRAGNMPWSFLESSIWGSGLSSRLKLNDGHCDAAQFGADR